MMSDETSNKKRTKRACDRCKKAKSKCERESDDVPCMPCINAKVECTFDVTPNKRGPAKGYLHVLEQRCHSVEALLGVLMSIPDQRAISLLTEVSEDPYARHILDQVNSSAFGVSGRGPVLPSSQLTPNEMQADPFTSGPTNIWQNVMIAKFRRSSVSPDLTPFGATEAIVTSPSLSGPESSDFDGSIVDDDDTAAGQLVLSENNQIQFRGRSSGLHLLDQVARRRLNYEEKDLWYLNRNDVGVPVEFEQLPVTLPPLDVQRRLLELYQDFSHASFPIIDHLQLWQSFYALNRGEHVENGSCFKLLLLSIYSVAISHLHWGNRADDGNFMLRDNIMGQAKTLLKSMFNTNHLMICQSTLLLALKEFGAGNLTQSWILTGVAVRMAMSLGLNWSSEHWLCGGRRIYDDHDKEMRERVWFGCIQLDTYLSLFLGRTAFFDREMTNVSAPVNSHPQLDSISWPMTVHTEFSHFSPIPGNIGSTWVAGCSLAFIVSDITKKLYRVGKGSTFDSKRVSEGTKLEKEFQQWSAELPARIALNAEDESIAAPPHVLGLHMLRHCVMISLQYPFITLQDIQPGSLSLQALHKALESAANINILASTYLENFGVSGASPFFSHQIFMAGTIWAVASTLEPQDASHTLGLKQSMDRLDELKPVWHSAKQYYDLLQQAIFPCPTQTIVDGSGSHVVNPELFYMPS